jgi:hypothetical protein
MFENTQIQLIKKFYQIAFAKILAGRFCGTGGLNLLLSVIF